jgi:hypothetical protein
MVLPPTLLQWCVGVQYDIYSLQVNTVDLDNSMEGPSPLFPPHFYFMIVQRICAISCGASIVESLHSEEGS